MYMKLHLFGGKKMAFIGSIISTLIKMAVIGAVAFGGIMLGKTLRNKKQDKDA